MQKYAIARQQWGPLVTALVVAIVYLCFPQLSGFKFPPTLLTVMQAAGNFAAIMVGFLCTVKSILITINEKPIIQELKKSNRYNRIIDNIWAAICYSLLMAFTSAVGLFFDLSAGSAWTRLHAVGFAVWLFSVVVAFLSLLRVMRLFHALLRE